MTRRQLSAVTMLLLPLLGQGQGLTVHQSRQAESDLEITGLVSQLPPGAVGYVTYAELRRLPQITVQVHGDENFAPSQTPRGLRVSGVSLEVLRRALGVLPNSDLMEAWCSDDYHAHYPATYIATHHPLLGLTIEGQAPAAWAASAGSRDPGSYFITHARFTPALRILAHSEQPQVPTGIVRLHFGTAADTFGAVTPRGAAAQRPAVLDGFAIAEQNCLRCHYQGKAGGTKSGRTWGSLGTWAHEQPSYFAGYVHNPRALEEHAHMPANLGYDRATISALTAYFESFAGR